MGQVIRKKIYIMVQTDKQDRREARGLHLPKLAETTRVVSTIADIW